nr:sulfotransferase family protein [Fodinicola feengrottensis]
MPPTRKRPYLRKEGNYYEGHRRGLPAYCTSTQQTVLNKLGFGPCYHMREVMEHPEHIDSWVAAYSGEKIDLVATFAGYQSTTDSPGCYFWRELMEAYPDAKVLLSVRDPEKWYQSMIKTVLNEDLFKEVDGPTTSARRLVPVMFDRMFGGSREKRPPHQRLQPPQRSRKTRGAG